MCIKPYSDNTGLNKRGGEISCRPQAVCELGWWNGALETVQRGLVLSRSCCCSAALPLLVTPAGLGLAWGCACACQTCCCFCLGLGRERARHSLPDLSTYRNYLCRGDDGVHVVSIVLLPSAAQQTWLPMETSIYLKKRILVIHAVIFQSFFPFQWKIRETTRNKNGWFCSGVLIVLKNFNFYHIRSLAGSCVAEIFLLCIEDMYTHIYTSIYMKYISILFYTFVYRAVF